MLRLEIPSVNRRKEYVEMIKEWQQYGGPYVPCIVEYDCTHPIEKLDYGATLKVVNDYSQGIIFDYDVDYFKSSDFYFVFDDEQLIGVGEIRHNLTELGKNTIGHLALGIRPSARGKKYALPVTEMMIDILQDEGLIELVMCHYSENMISPKVIKKLGLSFRNNTISDVSHKEIKCYTKKLNPEKR